MAEVPQDPFAGAVDSCGIAYAVAPDVKQREAKPFHVVFLLKKREKRENWRKQLWKMVGCYDMISYSGKVWFSLALSRKTKEGKRS